MIYSDSGIAMNTPSLRFTVGSVNKFRNHYMSTKMFRACAIVVTHRQSGLSVPIEKFNSSLKSYLRI